MTIFTTIAVAIDNADELRSVSATAVLTVERHEHAFFSFSLDVEIAGGVADLPALLEHAADRLPLTDFLITTDLERVVAALERTATIVPPMVAAHLGQRMARIKLATLVDLSLPRHRPMLDPRERGRKVSVEPPNLSFEAIARDPIKARATMRRAVFAQWCEFLRIAPADDLALGQLATATFLATHPELTGDPSTHAPRARNFP